MDILEDNPEPIPIIDFSFLKIFGNTLKQQNLKLIKRICEDYNLNLDELTKKYLYDNSINLNNNKSPLIIKKKREIDKSLLCMARVISGSEEKQCSFKKCEKCDYCKNHNKILLIDKELKHGRIDEVYINKKIETTSKTIKIKKPKNEKILSKKSKKEKITKKKKK